MILGPRGSRALGQGPTGPVVNPALIIVPLPKKGDLSLMTNYRGISLLLITAKVYNKILLNRIRDNVDPILRSNQDFRPGRSCAQQIHILRRIMEGFQDYRLPLQLHSSTLRKPLTPSKEISCLLCCGIMGYLNLWSMP